MEAEYYPVADVIAQRRSVRRFSRQPVARSLVRELVSLACRAPAPHDSRPWRFAYVATDGAKGRLAEAMSGAWLADLEAAETPVREVQRLLSRSKEQISTAPALLAACLDLTDAREQPDERRCSAERAMFVQSLGAALQNMLLAAVERGLAGYLKGAPLFCAPAVRGALELPDGWEPAFLVLLGHPEEGFEPPPRADVDVGDVMVER
jgi:coenzyme F420-0:L-glutamate ligase/coenzyme F420-1:gamma-L-glutamate ligase